MLSSGYSLCLIFKFTFIYILELHLETGTIQKKSKDVYKYPDNKFPSFFLHLAILESVRNRLKIGLTV